MFRGRRKLQVLHTVIVFVTVLVVYNFMWLQKAPQLLLQYNAMSEDVASTFPCVRMIRAMNNYIPCGS